MVKFFDAVSGVIVVVALASMAYLFSQYTGISGTVMALVVGFLVSNVLVMPTRFEAGISWVECHGLAAAVALLGLQLNWSVLMQINFFTLGLIVVTIILTFCVTWLLAKTLKIGDTATCLLASGQSICGSAAIMATAKAINAPSQAQTGLIIAVINFLGFIGVFLSTWLVQYYFTDDAYAGGLLVGNTLQSMGHVVAAGFSVSEPVGHGAVLIKMCRILLLVPTLILVIVIFNKPRKTTTTNLDETPNNSARVSWLKLVPWFIWAFLGLMVLNNVQVIPNHTQQIFNQVSHLLFVLAMVAIGLSIRLRHIWQHGIKLLLLGSLVFVIQISMTLLLVSYF